MKKRVACLLMSGLFFTVMQSSFAAGAGHSGRQFDGDWVRQYSCDDYHMSADDVKRCKEDGTADSFGLYSLTQEGDRICGLHVATADLTRRVDDAESVSVYGAVKGGVAKVRFKSARSDDDDDFGEATLKRVGDTLIWTKIKALKGEDLFPDRAVLSRAAGNDPYEPIHCGDVAGTQ